MLFRLHSCYFVCSNDEKREQFMKVFLLFLIIAAFGHCSEVRVSVHGSDAPSCGSQPNGCRTLTFAVAQSQFNDTILFLDAIFPLQFTNISAATLTLTSQSGTVLNCTENFGILVQHAHVTASHLTFTGCSRLSSPSTSALYGSALSAIDSTLVVQHCSFLANTMMYAAFGGALGTLNSAVTVTDSLFVGNSAVSGAAGAAITVIHGSAQIERCRFVDNTAVGSYTATGGAMYLFQVTLAVVLNTLFVGNTASQGLTGYGGALYASLVVQPQPIVFTIAGCEFANNTAVGIPGQGTGGAGGAISIFVFDPPSGSSAVGFALQLTNNTFTGNNAMCSSDVNCVSEGGAVHMSLGSLQPLTVTFDGSIFANNSASVVGLQPTGSLNSFLAYGGAVSIEDYAVAGVSITVSNCVFVGCTTVSLNALSANAVGGALYANVFGQSYVTLINSSFTACAVIVTQSSPNSNSVATGGAVTVHPFFQLNPYPLPSVSITACSFEANYISAVGAITCMGGALGLTDAAVMNILQSTFYANSLQCASAVGSGAAVSVSIPSNAVSAQTLTSVVFTNNVAVARAVSGGAVSLSMVGSTFVTITANEISDNIARSSGVAAAATAAPSGAQGGALYILSTGSSADLMMTGVSVQNNRVEGVGSSVVAQGGGVYVSTTVSNSLGVNIQVTGCETTNNTVQLAATSTGTCQGGGMYFITEQRSGISGLFVTDSTFTHNSISTAGAVCMACDGGGLFVASGGQWQASLGNVTVDYNNISVGEQSAAARHGQGGGLYFSNAVLTLFGGSFSHNVATRGGGAFFVDATVSASNSTVRSNRVTRDGGGFFVLVGDVLMLEALFERNVAGGLGGAIFIFLSQSNGLVLTSTNVTHNSAASAGGVYVGTAATLLSDRSHFAHNKAEFSGGAAVTDGSASFSGSVFTDNSATLHGGALQAFGLCQLVLSQFTRNIGGSDGGAVSAEGRASLSCQDGEYIGNSAGDGGAVALQFGSTASFVRSAMNNNHAVMGGALMTNAGSLCSAVNVTMRANKAIESGGAIAAQGTLTINDPILANCSAGEAGGGLVSYGDGVTMTGGAVLNNTAQYGGGVSLGLSGDQSGSIGADVILYTAVMYNQASRVGGGVYVNLPRSGLVSYNTVVQNAAPVGAQYSTTAQSIVASVALSDSPQCRGGAANNTARALSVPSGCSFAVNATLYDAFMQQTVPPLPNQQALGLATDGSASSCTQPLLRPPACISGIVPQLVSDSPVSMFTATASGAVGSPLCIALAMGSVASAPLVGSLSACPAGSENPSTGNCDSCHMCPSGLFDIGQRGQCTSCAFSDADRCVDCSPVAVNCRAAAVWTRAGYFGVYDRTANAVIALTCAEGMCDEVCAAASPTAAVNCTDVLVNDMSPFDCIDPQPLNSTAQVTGYCMVTSVCVPGRAGFLCGTCEEGHSEWDGHCVECTQPNWGTIVGLLLLYWLYNSVLHVALSGSQTSISKILVFFAQFGVLAVPNAIGTWLAVLLSVFRLPSGGSGHCVFPRSYFGQFAQSLLMLPLSVAQCSTVVLIIAIVQWRRGQPFDRQRWLLRPLLSLLLSAYVPVTVAVFDLLNCRTVQLTLSQSVRVLVSSPALLCAGPLYDRYFIVAVSVVVLFVVAAPLAAALMLWRGASRRTAAAEATVSSPLLAKLTETTLSVNKSDTSITASDDAHTQFGDEQRVTDRHAAGWLLWPVWLYFAECYDGKWFWWELVGLLRRAALLAATLVEVATVRRFVFAVLCTASFAVQALCRPYGTVLDNNMAVLADGALAFLAFVQASQLQALLPDTVVWLATVVLLLPLLAMAATLVYLRRDRLRELWQRVRACVRRPASSDDAAESVPLE